MTRGARGAVPTRLNRSVCACVRLLYEGFGWPLLWPVEPVVRLHRVSATASGARRLSTWLVDGRLQGRLQSTVPTSASRRHMPTRHWPQTLHAARRSHLVTGIGVSVYRPLSDSVHNPQNPHLITGNSALSLLQHRLIGQYRRSRSMASSPRCNQRLITSRRF